MQKSNPNLQLIPPTNHREKYQNIAKRVKNSKESSTKLNSLKKKNIA
jgi:hypothetical protein